MAKASHLRVAKHGTTESIMSFHDQVEDLAWELAVIEREMRRRHATLLG